MDAINTAMGVSLTAVAQPAGTTEPTRTRRRRSRRRRSWAAVVPGQTFDVQVTFVSPRHAGDHARRASVSTPARLEGVRRARQPARLAGGQSSR